MVPEWLVPAVAVTMGIIWAGASWVERQAIKNWAATRRNGDTDITETAVLILVRVSILWLAQTTLTVLYTLIVLFPQPRAATVEAAITYGLLALTALVAAASVHELRQMIRLFED